MITFQMKRSEVSMFHQRQISWNHFFKVIGSIGLEERSAHQNLSIYWACYLGNLKEGQYNFLGRCFEEKQVGRKLSWPLMHHRNFRRKMKTNMVYIIFIFIGQTSDPKCRTSLSLAMFTCNLYKRLQMSGIYTNPTKSKRI